jgi:hypothetical protein
MPTDTNSAPLATASSQYVNCFTNQTTKEDSKEYGQKTKLGGSREPSMDGT